MHTCSVITCRQELCSEHISFIFPGLHTDSDLKKMIEEINKMENLHHPNVMPLIGVCLDAGNGMSIIMPFMANGSLLDYLKKERANLYLKSDTDLHTVSGRKTPNIDIP